MLSMEDTHLCYSKITGTQWSCMQNKHWPYFFFFKEIHKMMMPAHALPQNGCYFASASMWQKAIYILHTRCKLTTTLQQRPIVQLCTSQSGHHTVASVCLLTTYYRIHTVIIIILYIEPLLDLRLSK